MRPSSFKKGGGFLDGVDVKWLDYQFTDEFNGEPFKPGKIKDRNGKSIDKPHSLNCFLTFQVDGAEEPTTTTLRAASDFNAYEVSEDGHVLTAAEGGECNISAKSALGKFITSLCEGGFPDSNFSDDPDSIDFTPALNSRFRLIQRTDAERTKEFGKKKGRDGKEYERKDLVVDTVLELPEAEDSKPSKASKTSGKTNTKGKKVEDNDEEDADLEQVAKDTLKAILKKEKDEKILKNKLSVKVLTALSKHPQREDVRKLIYSDDFLEQQDGWEYNKAKGMIVLDE